MSIQLFLLSRVSECEADFFALTKPEQEVAVSTVDADRIEIESHHDRTMVVTSRAGTETVTRCGICAKESSRPCHALKVMALPYASHPDYQQIWQINPPAA